MPFIRQTLWIGLSLFAITAHADKALEARITQAVEQVLEDAKVTSVAPGPIAGIYEVMVGPSLLYVSEDGRYIFKGDVFDLDSLENISKARRASARVEAFASLDSEDMIEFSATKGKAKRTIYVYTDIDCGYCRKMHLEVKTLNDAGIAVRYLAFPRSGLNGESYQKAVSVWCATDRQDALTASKAGKTLPPASCANPVADHYEMGQAMGVRGTPAVYSDEGEPMGGYVPARELIRLLEVTKG